MWWVKEHPDHGRGGFQNRDVGKSDLSGDFGPDYGVDYAHFSDPPDLHADKKTFDLIQEKLSTLRVETLRVEVLVRNGFVILKGQVIDEITRNLISREISVLPGVIEVINHLHVSRIN